MKLLVNIDPDLLSEVMKATGAKTKKDAIVIPMKEYLRQRKLRELASLVGKAPIDYTLADLLKDRKSWR